MLYDERKFISGGKDTSLLSSIPPLHQLDNGIVHKMAMNKFILSPAFPDAINQRKGPAPYQEKHHIEK